MVLTLINDLLYSHFDLAGPTDVIAINCCIVLYIKELANLDLFVHINWIIFLRYLLISELFTIHFFSQDVTTLDFDALVIF